LEKTEIRRLLAPGNRVHLIGVGGVSMSALAEVLQRRGLIVTGSDRCQRQALERLTEIGLRIAMGERPSLIAGCAAVIRTAAAKDDNPEVIETRRLNLPLLERAEAWGALMLEYESAVCIAGTHGKTTTTGMLAHITIGAGLDPTIMLGGHLPLLGAGHRVGRGNTIILESCEYCNSFHHFSPNVAVLLNIEPDHMDFFTGLEDILKSFRTFAGSVGNGGFLIGNGDDENVRSVLEGFSSVIWFGTEDSADITLEDVKIIDGCWQFRVVSKGSYYAEVFLKVPGRHNALNALAAAAVGYALGLPGKEVGEGISCFTGVSRRMEYVGQINGADIYDDYAHHPTEIKAALETVRSMGKKRVICAFQPHTYTRTKTFFNDFVDILSVCDKLYLSEIYAARELNPGDISSDMLAEKIPGAQSFNDFDALADAIRREAGAGDIILTAGAGDINKVAQMLSETYRS